MTPVLPNLLLYILAKFFAYTVWSVFGIHLFASAERAANLEWTSPSGTSPKKWLAGAGYGLLRLLMGLFFGLLIWVLASTVAESFVNEPHRDLTTYLAVYVPIRLLEWSILAWIIARNSGKAIGYGWRLGGIAISCLADIPIIAAMGWELPLGRFFC